MHSSRRSILEFSVFFLYSNPYLFFSIADDSPVGRCVDPPPLSDGFHVSDEAMARVRLIVPELFKPVLSHTIFSQIATSIL